MREGNEYEVTIDSVSSDGNGVCRIDGMAVFVPFTVSGDKVRIKITKVKKRFASGVLKEIITPSADRVLPECVNYQLCGGCRLRHIEYSKQLEVKKDIVENAMRRIGGFTDFSLEEIIGMENPSRYRNKMIFHADGTSIGFYAAKSHNIIPACDCDIGIEENAAIIKSVSGFGITELFTRKSFSTGEIMVLISAKDECDGISDVLLKECKNISSIYYNGNNIYGKNTITDTICGVKFEISPESFFQINPIQTERLYSKAMEFAAPDTSTTVMDIYCGIGTISLCTAKNSRSVIGVEVVERAILDARKNAKLNGIKNAEFYAGSAEKIVPRLVRNGEKTDVVFLDPPRRGSDEKTLGAITEAKPDRIIYVSCNPATLARDARFLYNNGYTIKRAAAVDMFPHTSHVETVVLMSRNGSRQ